jgi:Protein of unknown function (DUF1549)/Protein of unknown function (DUF1553)/Planctomycete cytochrome C
MDVTKRLKLWSLWPTYCIIQIILALPPAIRPKYKMQRLTLFLVAIAAISQCALAEEQLISDEDFRYFERKVRPILVERCYSCHSGEAKVLHGGLRLDNDTVFRNGGENGPAVIAGNPDESLLIQSIRYAGDLQMPPKGKLPEAEIHELTEWVRRGAHFPKSQSHSDQPPKQINLEDGRKFWSFQPAKIQTLPKVNLAQWPKNRIDAFVLEAIEREGLQPAAPADRATLIRRLSFDLTGLPPTPDSVRAFVADQQSNAFELLVDNLMASIRHGEKWGRLWLDLARYTDQTESWLLQEGQAHYYRDWVVTALNDDMPYNDFVRRQLAVDLMPGTNPEDLTALGFVGLSPTYWKELQLPCEVIKTIVADEWEERIDAVCSTFLGLTVACARCHDHKFDPISSADYHAIAGIFASSRQVGRPLVSEELYRPVREAKAEVAKLETEVTKLKAEIAKQTKEQKLDPGLQPKLDEITHQIGQLKATPLYDAPIANALSEESLYIERAGAKPQDGTKLVYRPGPQDLPLFSRGDPNRPGEIIPRGFIKVLSSSQQSFQYGSGRLELAEAITSDAADLAARVIVNRIWLAHFGQGLVNTPSNFGTQGGRPTHPELLEDLTARFMANNWSIKWLHREILLSATWQQSVVASEKSVVTDPGNRWLSHMNRRRHDFEAWRDTMLFASGSMDLLTGGISRTLDEVGNPRRTLYCTVHRREPSMALQIHDFPDANQHSPQRFATTTAIQGLYALNGPLLAEQAQLLAKRLEREFPNDEAARIDRAHWLLYSRPSTPAELQLGLDYLSDSVGEERLNRWKQYTHALLASNEILFLE